MWLVVLLLVIVPGFLLSTLLVERKLVLLMAAPLATANFVLCSLLSQLAGASHLLIQLYLASIVVTAIAVALLPYARAKLAPGLAALGLFVPPIVVITVYGFLAGPFIDHGVDLFQHLVFVQEGLRFVEESGGQLKFALRLGTKNYIFHNIAVLLSLTFGLSATDLISIYQISFSLIWTFTVFYFSFYVFGRCGLTGSGRLTASYLAIFFYWTAFGINNFAFARYYVAGPVILNYGIFLAALVLYLEIFYDGLRVRPILLAALLLAVAAIIHPQELLLFIGFVYSSVAVFLAYRLTGRHSQIGLGEFGYRTTGAVVLFAGITISLITVIVLEADHKVAPIPIVSLAAISDWMADWHILRPNHQFYTVLGLWGLYVYCIAILFWKSIITAFPLVVGLALPAVTVFNPLFSEAYIRVAYPEVLWRLLLAMPLPLVAAYLIAVIARKFSFQRRFTTAGYLVILIPVFALLVVFKLGPVNNAMAKSPSLIPTPQTNSYAHWADLIGFLHSTDKTYSVLTDPATGYLVRSLTSHKHSGFKFYYKNFRNFNFEDYSSHPLKRFKGWLLIVNERDGDINERLNPPLHIYPEVMKVARHYSPQLLQEVENPDRYEKIFDADNIRVFVIL